MAFWSNKNDEEKSTRETSAIEKPSSAATSSRSTTSFSVRAEKSLEQYGKVRSALSEGTVIQGKLSFDTPVRIDGKLSGEVYSTSVLIVGEKGEVDADVQAESLIIEGKVKGKVKAIERIELRSGGTLEGDITSGVLVIEENSVFNGNCTMGKVPHTLGVTSADIKKAGGKKAAQSESVSAESRVGSEQKGEQTSEKDKPATPEIRVH